MVAAPSPRNALYDETKKRIKRRLEELGLVGKLLSFLPEITTAAVDMKQEVYLLGPAESHPHFESSEEQLNHLVVLEIHSWTV